MLDLDGMLQLHKISPNSRFLSFQGLDLVIRLIVDLLGQDPGLRLDNKVHICTEDICIWNLDHYHLDLNFNESITGYLAGTPY